MSTNEQDIQAALDIIYEKTHIPFDIKNVIIEQNMSKREHWSGCYRHGTKIYLNPKIFKPLDEAKLREQFRENDYLHIICNKEGKLVRQTEDEYIASKVQERFDDILEVISHEIGHYVHNVYFNNMSMYLRGRTRYARKNKYENFAVAFQQYVQNRLIHHSKRYIKIDHIIQVQLKETIKYRLDNGIIKPEDIKVNYVA